MQRNEKGFFELEGNHGYMEEKISPVLRKEQASVAVVVFFCVSGLVWVRGENRYYPFSCYSYTPG
jgi:hypothetical protein